MNKWIGLDPYSYRCVPVLFQSFYFKLIDYSDDEEESKAKAAAKKKRQSERYLYLFISVLHFL